MRSSDILAGCTDFPRFGRGRRLFSDSTDLDSTTHGKAVDSVVDQSSIISDLDPDPFASVALPSSTTTMKSNPSATTASTPFNPSFASQKN